MSNQESSATITLNGTNYVTVAYHNSRASELLRQLDEARKQRDDLGRLRAVAEADSARMLLERNNAQEAVATYKKRMRVERNQALATVEGYKAGSPRREDRRDQRGEEDPRSRVR